MIRFMSTNTIVRARSDEEIKEEAATLATMWGLLSQMFFVCC